MSLTETGYSNILGITNDRLDLNLTKEFIDEHYETFIKAWPAADDGEMWMDFPEAEEAWWTFEYECNGGGIDDTCQRDRLMDVVAQILFGMCWPMNGDSADFQQLFNEKLNKHRSKKCQVATQQESQRG